MIDGLRDDQGKRFRKFFESKETAKTWLSNHREKSLVEGRAGLAFTDAQRADARRALAELTAFPSATLTDASRHFAEHLRRTERTVTVEEMVALFIDAKTADGRSPRYLADLRSRLGKFERSFGPKPTAGVTTAELDDWLRGLRAAPQSRVNMRRILHALFGVAVSRNYARENPVARTQKPKVVAKEPGFLKPEQIARLLDAADESIRPALAIAAFAGLRPAEVSRLRWDDVNLTERFIVVSAKTSKTASRRLVPMADNLLAWLMQAPSRMGNVQPPGFDKRFISARKASEIDEWPHDGLRHSWVTYRFAATGDAARTASEAGHDQAVLHKHYKSLAARAEAERWFAVVPGEGEKTVAFTPVAAQA